MRKLGLVAALAVLLGATALYAVARSRPAVVSGSLSAVAAASGDEDSRWRRVAEPRPFQFPADHGPHPLYQTEWWYYTGNLTADDGRQFGYQLTFFRRGLDPEPAERQSRWATTDIYLAHFTVSDLQDEQFYAAERWSRNGADLAGASGAPYFVRLGSWQASGSGPEGMSMRLVAATDEVAIDLQLQNGKPPTLQGDRGYSPKGAGAGNASYYYSLTRMVTTGVLSIGDRSFTIRDGASWMDHEWGTSRLEEGAVGWDWFALQLSDGREITWAQVRQADGVAAPASFGSLTEPNGSTRRLTPADITLEVTDHWSSPRSGARYPAGWRITIPSAGLRLAVTPRMADQELPVSIVYWEGAVAVEGEANAGNDASPISGQGYVELTGYVPNTSTTALR